jgi:hypothetical protein
MKKNNYAFPDMTIEEMEKALKDDVLGKEIKKLESVIKNKRDEVNEYQKAQKGRGIWKPENNPTTTEEKSPSV